MQTGHQASGCARVHAFIRGRGKAGNPRPRAICNYADVEGDGYTPFCNLNEQIIANISTPRPGVTEPRDVTRVFKLIGAPWTRARFSDVVGLALRFDALTIPRPGMVNEMEWSEVDWDAKRWTIPAAKMKTGWDHVVPLSGQTRAILNSVQKLTGHRRYVFSCSKDAPLTANRIHRLPRPGPSNRPEGSRVLPTVRPAAPAPFLPTY
jgi:integrase